MTSSLQDEDTVQWEMEVKSTVEPTQKSRETVDLTGQTENGDRGEKERSV